MSEMPSSPCTHSSIRYTSSSHARAVGFKRPGKPERLTAANTKGASSREKPSLDDSPMIFPPPLIIPNDDLAIDPEYPTQSFQEWLDEEERNPVTEKRRNVYVVPPPLFDDQVSFME
ncbi:hypothetical protein N7456_000422 [Penicillium angulare]|uniref:Uncharacterized protein n=1 Tax=Penicillium angulare TaxID=116970 RepID=A0A9W9KS78_9EURO|nr:hypothetical protein N7456_000422 [Penicillium angulare]